MKLSSKRTIESAAVIALLLLAVTLWGIVKKSSQMQTSVDAGEFEDRYASAKEALRTHTADLRNKFEAGNPGPLNLRPERNMSQAKSGTEQDEKLSSQSDHSGPINLHGIYWSPSMPLAEINGKIYKPGEKIGGFILQEISPYQVTLTDASGRRTTVRVFQDRGDQTQQVAGQKPNIEIMHVE